MINVTKKDLEVLQKELYEGLKYAPQEDWKRIIGEIIEDKFFGLKYVAHFDGSAKPNPGEMKIGGHITTPKQNMVYSYSEDLGKGTNNEAEYLSLIHVAEKLVELGATSVKIFGDSQLVVNQVNGLWRTKDPRMKIFQSRVVNLLNKIPHWELTHVYREQNMEADALTR